MLPAPPPPPMVRLRPRAEWGRRLKALLGRLAYATGLYRAFFRDKALVVLFHRIDDGLPGDPITCSRSAFRAYCDFFQRYFSVVPLGVLLEKLNRGEDISRHLVITFDDGYQDNARLAAPDLRERNMPACFFITTGFIGTDRQAPWDEELGVRSMWMDWSEVRQLHGLGFEIGAHSVNHVDFASVSGEVVETELCESRRRLEAELGARLQFFSYPFGRRENVTKANQDRVRRAGFSCCASAYGGAVSSRDDVLHIRRTPISPWYLSPYQFGFEVMVQRSARGDGRPESGRERASQERLT